MAAISIAVTTDKSADSSTNQPSQNTHLPLQAKVKNTGKMKEKLKKRLYVGGCSILFIPLILWHIGIHWRSSCEISICCESFKLYEGGTMHLLLSANLVAHEPCLRNPTCSYIVEW
eukprot:TRINITY_DN5188_c0_g1_i1.p1 TRINITY_DN5188_c0_g1~~TRINITY_DN5188_c0_g1_i1.p1  ORF type:complete len:116 (+),score=6.72 TRINITY_DN5188_c0_g1_i1:296-643(+)